MNEIVNKFLLDGNENNPDLLIAPVDHLLKTRKELKKLKKQKIQTTFTKMNLIRLVLNMIWLTEILKT